MAATLACDPAVGPHTALDAAWARLRRRLTRTLGFVGLLCVAIAVLLTAIDGGGFGTKLVYSLCIGAACMCITDGVRLAAAAAVDRLRALRGLPQHPSGFESGWRGVLPAAVAAPIVGPFVGMWLGDLLTGHQSASLLRFSESGSRVTLALSVLGTAATVFVLSTLERLSSVRAQAEAAQRLAAENQLRLLQSQLEPHMLFNTLANLRVLITLDPPRAQAMLDRLINFLRATLNASRADSHPLATEFQHLDDYLALMAVRMGTRLAVQLDMPADLASLPVPPLLLQPLVENAIKHGLEPKVEGGRIEVRARRVGSLLRLSVRDTGIGLRTGAATAGSAFGLEQVRTRLATLHPGRASLALADAPDAAGGVLATIELPLQQT